MEILWIAAAIGIVFLVWCLFKGSPVKNQPLQRLAVVSPQIQPLPQLQEIITAIDAGTSPIFLTGKAGTGKSTLIRQIVAAIPSVAVVAPTGRAALNVGGVTIHSFFSFPSKTLDPDSFEVRPPRKMIPVFQSLRALIVDEVSMVTPDKVDCMDLILRRVRRDSRPFGGVPVIFVGDLHQLSPVVVTKAEYEFFTHRYRSEYFFDADVFKAHPLRPVWLTKVFRQENQDFAALLDRLRTGRDVDESLQALNDARLYVRSENATIHIVPTNGAADAINRENIDQLTTPLRRYDAAITGKFKPGEDRSPAPDTLEIKEGALVIFVKNKTGRWVNGTLGQVIEVRDNIIRIRISGQSGIVDVERETWEQEEKTYNHETRRVESTVVGTFTQFPLRLGWAITIHKSQGMTLDAVTIDMANGAFASGQTYVALSRCKTLEGIHLLSEIRAKDIIVSEKIREYYRSLPGCPPEEF